MAHSLYLNLPVADLVRSREFFTAVGFSFNETFSNDDAACLVVTDNISVMLLTEKFFGTFTDKALADTRTTVAAIACLGVETRDEVDRLADAALAAGAEHVKAPMDEGFMYGRSFRDLDGHHWEVMWMDAS